MYGVVLPSAYLYVWFVLLIPHISMYGLFFYRCICLFMVCSFTLLFLHLCFPDIQRWGQGWQRSCFDDVFM